MIVPPTLTSPPFARSRPPISKIPTPPRFPAGKFALSSEFSCYPRLWHTQAQGKGQSETGQWYLCSLLRPNYSKTPNSHIHRQDPVAITPVHYQYVLQRIWRRIYNICINHSDKDIMIYKDELVSNIRRIFNHPYVAAAYTFVLGTYLVMSVGMVFGYRTPPSLLCLIS